MRMWFDKLSRQYSSARMDAVAHVVMEEEGDDWVDGDQYTVHDDGNEDDDVPF